MSFFQSLRSALAPLPLLALLLAAPGCGVTDAALAPGSPDALLDDLAFHRARWAAAGVRDYTYRLEVSCACPPALVKPVQVVVREGRTVSVTYADDGSPALWTGFGDMDTVEELFRLVERAARERADYLAVEYETARALGYPVSAVIDPRHGTSGDQLEFIVPSLTVDDV